MLEREAGTDSGGAAGVCSVAKALVGREPYLAMEAIVSPVSRPIPSGHSTREAAVELYGPWCPRCFRT
jgi:hypothetical protein